MINLPDVTVVIADTRNYGLAINAIQKTLQQIMPAKTLFFTNIKIETSSLEEMGMPGVEIVEIPNFYNKSAYSRWMIKELGKQDIKTSHVLVIQHDGYVLDADQWDPEYLKYDYIGAPWLETDGMNVGNGGFSLRSFSLHQIIAGDDFVHPIHPEDGLCRIYRDYLEHKYHLTWAPEELAHKFSYELHEPKDKTFGFHGKFHDPYYLEPICIKRTGALGDVIQVEPVLEYFHSKGHPVYLDTMPGFYQIFANHFFKVGDYSKFDKDVIKHRVINLDHAYEVYPKQLHLKSYFDMAGVTDYVLRNPKLNRHIQDENRLFKRYALIHIDKRETPYRNIYGKVDWVRIKHFLEDKGLEVIQIGKNEHEECGMYFNTVNEMMALWAAAGCEVFLGIDSGIAAMAVATQRKSVIFFGSVNPAYIHPDLSKVTVIRNACPIANDYCWHSAPGTAGQECSVEGQQEQPPCCVFTTEQVLEALKKAMA